MDKVKSPLLKNKHDYFGMAMTGIYTMALTASTVMATAMASEIGAKIKSAMETLYADVKDAFNAAAIAATAICLFILLFGRSDKTAEKAYSWLFKIVVSFVIFHSLGWLVPAVLGLLGVDDTTYYTPSRIHLPQFNIIV